MNIKKIVIILIFLLVVNILPSFADVAPVPIIPTEFWINKKGMIVFPTEKQKTENYRYIAHINLNAYYDEETNILTYNDESGKEFLKINLNDNKFPVNRYSEGLVAVEKDGRYGFINTDGEMVIEPQYIPANCYNMTQTLNHKQYLNIGVCDLQFNEGLAHVKYNEQPVVYSKNILYDAVVPDDFNIDTLAMVKGLYWDAYGEIKDGKFYIKNNPNREERRNLSYGRMYYKFKEGYIDKTGKIAIDNDYQHVNPFQEGLAVVVTKDLKYGYIDKSGKMVIKPKYKWAGSFHNGIARVKVEKKDVMIPFAIVLLIILIITSLSIKRNRN